METSNLTNQAIHENNNAILRITEYLRLLSQAQLEVRLSRLFDSPKEMRVYELSNGARSTRELAELTNGDKDGISDLWKKWQKMGLTTSTGPKKPYKANFTLVELALIQSNKLNGDNPE